MGDLKQFIVDADHYLTDEKTRQFKKHLLEALAALEADADLGTAVRGMGEDTGIAVYEYKGRRRFVKVGWNAQQNCWDTLMDKYPDQSPEAALGLEDPP